MTERTSPEVNKQDRLDAFYRRVVRRAVATEEDHVSEVLGLDVRFEPKIDPFSVEGIRESICVAADFSSEEQFLRKQVIRLLDEHDRLQADLTKRDAEIESLNERLQDAWEDDAER